MSAKPAAVDATDEELVDYEEADQVALSEPASTDKDANANKKEKPRGSYAGIHSSGFRDFLLKEPLLMAITDCGFEHPSEGKLYSQTLLSH